MRQAVIRLARIAAATAIGGPLGGGGTLAADMAIKALTAGGGNGRPPADAEGMIDEVAKAVQSWAEHEQVPAEALDAGLARATEVIAGHGLTAGEIVAAGFRPERAVAQMLAEAGVLDDLGFAEEGVCRRALVEVYQRVATDPQRLRGLEVTYRQQVLSYLDTIVDRNSRKDDARIKLRLGCPQWASSLHPATALLRPEFRVVPFEGRESELDDLRTWCGDDLFGLRLYTGAGGIGKTRLLTEACLLLAGKGWHAGFLVAEDGEQDLATLPDRAAGTMIVIDYAETRPQSLMRILRIWQRTPDRRLRVVLRARSDGEWWHALLRRRERAAALLSGPAATRQWLSPVATDPGDRVPVVQHAIDAFARELKQAARPASGDYAGKHFEAILYLHLAALAELGGDVAGEPDGLLDAALRREEGFWQDGLLQLGLGHLAGRPMTQAAAVTYLAGSISGPHQAVEVLRLCPLLADQEAANLLRIAELLRRLYPGPAWLQGIQPDLLGEHLVARAVADDPTMLGVFDALDRQESSA